MAAKSKPAPRRAPAKARTPTHAGEPSYEVVLRTKDVSLTARVQDRSLYRSAVMWNRLLAADHHSRSDAATDRKAWHDSGRKAIVELAVSGGIGTSEVDAFISSAAKSGTVQVEMAWESESVGWAARVFPWEALIALATKPQREQLDCAKQSLVVVRWLRSERVSEAKASGPICFAVSGGAKQRGFDTSSERAAIVAGIAPKALEDLPADSLAQLREGLARVSPRVLHYVTPSARNTNDDRGECQMEGCPLEEIARTVSAHRPELVAFSSCFTGRRLAPLAIAHGAHLALGFHDSVMDSSCPVFFGAFYRQWSHTGDVFAALQQGIDAHNWKKPPGELGGVTLWSAHDLMSGAKKPSRKARTSRAPGKGTGDARLVKPELILAALKVNCQLEESLNYSMLHNQRGGLFAAFDVLKLQPGKLDDLEVTVTINSGVGLPVACHFFCALPEEPDRTVDFLQRVTVPLGSELLRRRGEMLRGTVEVLIACGQVRVFHSFGSLGLPPCDEWMDSESGRLFLPSFIFPRDPAVREILTSAQPFLRALNDDVRAAFVGYEFATTESPPPIPPLLAQLRSIWGALQLVCRLDYSNPPPSYTKNVQRVRTPEEILRSRRATCLELALLLASCWEHIGLHPVIFLSKGHAFTGYWVSAEAWRDFFDAQNRIDLTQELTPSEEGVKDQTLDNDDPSKASGGGMSAKGSEWLLRATHHLALISRAVKEGSLIPVEATFVARQESFTEATRIGREQLAEALTAGTFDGMIDVRAARDQHVTPLAIVTEGVVA